MRTILDQVSSNSSGTNKPKKVIETTINETFAKVFFFFEKGHQLCLRSQIDTDITDIKIML